MTWCRVAGACRVVPPLAAAAVLVTGCGGGEAPTAPVASLTPAQSRGMILDGTTRDWTGLSPAARLQVATAFRGLLAGGDLPSAFRARPDVMAAFLDRTPAPPVVIPARPLGGRFDPRARFAPASVLRCHVDHWTAPEGTGQPLIQLLAIARMWSVYVNDERCPWPPGALGGADSR